MADPDAADPESADSAQADVAQVGDEPAAEGDSGERSLGDSIIDAIPFARSAVSSYEGYSDFYETVAGDSGYEGQDAAPDDGSGGANVGQDAAPDDGSGGADGGQDVAPDDGSSGADGGRDAAPGGAPEVYHVTDPPGQIRIYRDRTGGGDDVAVRDAVTTTDGETVVTHGVEVVKGREAVHDIEADYGLVPPVSHHNTDDTGDEGQESGDPSRSDDDSEAGGPSDPAVADIVHGGSSAPIGISKDGEVVSGDSGLAEEWRDKQIPFSDTTWGEASDFFVGRSRYRSYEPVTDDPEAPSVSPGSSEYEPPGVPEGPGEPEGLSPFARPSGPIATDPMSPGFGAGADPASSSSGGSGGATTTSPGTTTGPDQGPDPNLGVDPGPGWDQTTPDWDFGGDSAGGPDDSGSSGSGGGSGSDGASGADSGGSGGEVTWEIIEDEVVIEDADSSGGEESWTYYQDDEGNYYYQDDDGTWRDADGNAVPEDQVPPEVVDAASADDTTDSGGSGDSGGGSGSGGSDPDTETTVAPDGEYLGPGPDDQPLFRDTVTKADLISPENIDPTRVDGGSNSPTGAMAADIVTLVGQPPPDGGGSTQPVGGRDDVVIGPDPENTDPVEADGVPETGPYLDDDPFANDTAPLPPDVEDPAAGVDSPPPTDQPNQPGMYTQAPTLGNHPVEVVGATAATPDDAASRMVEPVVVEGAEAATPDATVSASGSGDTTSVGSSVAPDDPAAPDGDGEVAGESTPDELPEPASALDEADIAADLSQVELTPDLEPEGLDGLGL